MANELAPPPTRHRASSTNVRPALTLSSLGRRRSNSLLDVVPATPSPSASPPRVLSPKPERNVPPPLSLTISSSVSTSRRDSSLSTLLSRCRDLLHMAHPSSDASSTPSSPRLSRTSTSSDDTILPISSPVTASFADAYPEKSAPPTPWWQNVRSAHVPVLLVIISFPVSAALVLLSMSTLPITVSWPRNITDLAQLGRELHGYAQSGAGPMAHVLAVLSVTAVWKHAWSIPGSVIWNVLAGALFSPAYATLLLTMLTTIGSVFASLLSAPMAPFLTKMFPKALNMTRSALEGQSDEDAKSSAWVRLSILRLIGIVPWSGINIACGVCGVPILDCVLGTFIGALPWTAVTCQIGDILQTVASNPSPNPQSVQSLLASREIIMKLVFLTVISLAPILGRDHLRAWVSSPASYAPVSQNAANDERVSRWAWVKEWRGKIHMPSRSRSRAREAFQKELNVLIREKNESLPM